MSTPLPLVCSLAAIAAGNLCPAAIATPEAPLPQTIAPTRAIVHPIDTVSIAAPQVLPDHMPEKISTAIAPTPTVAPPPPSPAATDSSFNSAKYLLPADPDAQISQIPSDATVPAPVPNPVNPVAPPVVLESLTTDFRNDADKGGKRNQFIEPTAQLRLANGDKIRLKTGLDTFTQPGIAKVTNIPIQVGWEHKIGAATLKTGAGIELFDDLPAVPALNTQLELPIGVQKDDQGRMIRGVVVSALADYGPYKFNAKTLRNGINVLHLKPSVYWQIDRDTSFYSHYQFGDYNDGNTEHQTFSRLERKFGQFFVAANVFTWNYQRDREATSGYFSPQDFLTYNGEIGWEGDVVKGLRCRAFTRLGQQRLSGNYSGTKEANVNCAVPLSPNLKLNLGYGISDVANRTTGNRDQQQSFSGQLQYNF